jgi:hypothetical protein
MNASKKHLLQSKYFVSLKAGILVTTRSPSSMILPTKQLESKASKRLSILELSRIRKLMRSSKRKSKKSKPNITLLL